MRQAHNDRTFTLSLDGADVPLLITHKAMSEFEVSGLSAMDDCLMRFSDRMTPANVPKMRPNPLDMIGQMLMDGAANGNTRKLMVCALWLAHHYPSVSGMNANGHIFSFTYSQAPAARPAAMG